MAKSETIQIDPAKFADRIPRDTDTGEQYFKEGDVLKFLVDQLNVAGVDVSMIHHGYETGIEYRGEMDYFSMSVTSLNAPEVAAHTGLVEVANLLNDRADLKSWVEYQHGLYYLHIEEVAEK